MEGRTLKMAAAGCFAVGVLATSLATRFDVNALFANVYTTLGGDSALTKDAADVAVVDADTWKSSFGSYATIVPASSTDEGVSGTSTVTDAFTQAIFEAYLINRAEGKITSSEDRAALGQQYAVALTASLRESPFTASDIRTSASRDIRTYIEALATMFDTHTGKHEHELVIFQRLAENPQTEDAELFARIVGLYAGMEVDGVRIEAPTTLATAHLNLMNAVRSIRSGLHHMAAVGTDPIRAAVGFETYTAGVSMMRAAIAEIQVHARFERVTFPEGTLGAKFMSIK